MNDDINSYFEYVDNIINSSKVNEDEKQYYRNLISLYKVCGIVTLEFNDITEDISTKKADDELYILYELLSMKFYKLLNYWSWKNRIEFGII
jgi:hypothetical protein